MSSRPKEICYCLPFLVLTIAVAILFAKSKQRGIHHHPVVAFLWPVARSCNCWLSVHFYAVSCNSTPLHLSSIPNKSLGLNLDQRADHKSVCYSIVQIGTKTIDSLSVGGKSALCITAVRTELNFITSARTFVN